LLAAVTRLRETACERPRAIAAFVELITADPRKARVLFVEAMGSESLRLRAPRRCADSRAWSPSRTSVLRRPERGEPARRHERLMMVGGLAETFMAWLDGGLRVTKAQLIEDCTDLFVVAGEGTVGLVRLARSPSRS